ncbi:anti-lipopolysaccharide factor-like [Panulirus ornatus]|uniref:anti-lipopolysaccharide factor-like n=1 Tax=Panulirus ornatus TaxID=150431 RepID=UPI003A8356E6
MIKLVMLALFGLQCQALLTWDDLVPAVIRKLERQWRPEGGEVILLNHSCSLTTNTTQHSYHRGTLSCPEWTNITGKALSRTVFGVVDDVTRDFFRKAVLEGLVNEADTDRWVSE